MPPLCHLGLKITYFQSSLRRIRENNIEILMEMRNMTREEAKKHTVKIVKFKVGDQYYSEIVNIKNITQEGYFMVLHKQKTSLKTYMLLMEKIQRAYSCVMFLWIIYHKIHEIVKKKIILSKNSEKYLL